MEFGQGQAYVEAVSISRKLHDKVSLLLSSFADQHRHR
jgi:hypothetical protein